MDDRISELDVPLRRMFAEYSASGYTVDDILVDPPVALEFARKVNEQIGDGYAAVAPVLRRLLTLRKRGERRGGLPRIGV